MSDKDNRSDEEPKSKFKIVDRRRASDEEEAHEPVSEEKVTPAKSEEVPHEVITEPQSMSPDMEAPVEENMEAPEGESEEFTEDPLGFRNVCLSFLQTLATISWVHLGMLPHPQTQLVVKKIDEARKTITLLETIYQQVKTEYPPEVNSEIMRLIADLKAAYVNQL
jgi:hypothetical protein